MFGDYEGFEREEQAQDVDEVQVGLCLMEAFRSLDGVDVGHLFSMRAVCMNNLPAFAKGAFRVGLRVEGILPRKTTQRLRQEFAGMEVVFVFLQELSNVSLIRSRCLREGSGFSCCWRCEKVLSVIHPARHKSRTFLNAWQGVFR